MTPGMPASNVSQHATSFDDNKLVNDLSTLGLRVHTQENLSASTTNSQYIDVFQDSTGITNLTDTNRNTNEYMSTISLKSVLIYETGDRRVHHIQQVMVVLLYKIMVIQVLVIFKW